MSNLEERINLVKNLKRFAVEKLGIVPNNSFEHVAKGHYIYFLYSARKDKIRPFLDNNKFGFKGFYTVKEAKIEQQHLESLGADTFIYKAEACGDFDMPILKSLLKATKTRLASIVLHENFHIHCEKSKITVEYPIEEAAATCFAHQGSLLFFASNKRMIYQIKKVRDRYNIFYDCVNGYIKKLEDAYETDVNKGRLLLEDIGKKFPISMNNAYLLMARYYSSQHRGVFEALDGLHPRDYTEHKMRLYRKLAKLKDGTPPYRR